MLQSQIIPTVFEETILESGAYFHTLIKIRYVREPPCCGEQGKVSTKIVYWYTVESKMLISITTCNINNLHQGPKWY